MHDCNKSLFKNLIQAGIVIGNLKKTMHSYVYSYGIGPMYILRFSHKNVSDMNLYGKRKNYSMFGTNLVYFVSK